MTTFAERLEQQKRAMAGTPSAGAQASNPFAVAPPTPAAPANPFASAPQTPVTPAPANPFATPPAVANVVNPPGEAAPENLDETPEDGKKGASSTPAAEPGNRVKKKKTKGEAEIEELEARTIFWQTLTAWVGRQK